MTDRDPVVADAAFDAILFDRQSAVPDLVEFYQCCLDFQVRGAGAGSELASVLSNVTDNAQSRFLVVQLLGFSGSQSSVETLLLALDDKEAAVRAEACRSLEDLACREAPTQLQKRLLDVDDEVRGAAAEAIEALRSAG